MNKRQLKSYVWYKDKCFFVSTIERDSSTIQQPPNLRYMETIIWEYSWETKKRGVSLGMVGEGQTLEQHFEVVRQLFNTGKYTEIG